MLKAIHSAVQIPLRFLRVLLDAGFVPHQYNPLRHLGSLTIFFFWIVLVSGIWLFIFFRTSVDGAYESVEYLTHNQWFLGGVMRSLHRYASDAAVVTLVLHIVREFSFDRYRGKRWFSWVTGIPLLWMIIPLGITGYWLVWDELAQYVALASAELLDALPIFTDSMARNFLSDEALSDRFFTLMAFLHLIGLPLFLVFGIWLHVLRINGPEVNPPRILMSGSLLAMLVLSLVFPAVSQGKADLATVPGALAMDWFYLLIYPLIDAWPLIWVWALLIGITVLIFLAPWLPPQRAKEPAVVNLDFCNGCERCVADCPFAALTMQARSDGKPYEAEAVVDPDVCISCGICVGSCPTATPFRTRGELRPGIDLPDSSMASLRETIIGTCENLSGDRRILIFGCEGSEKLRAFNDRETAVISLVCMAQLPPSFIDYVLSRGHADAVLMAGCGPDACQFRLGTEWTSARLHRQRDPQLRKRVELQRVAMAWEPQWADCSISEILSALRNDVGSDSSVPAVNRRAKALRLKKAAAYAAFAVLIGVFSVWPRYRLINDDEAIVSLTFSHAGQRLQKCRTLSQEELQKLPPNMRNPSDCPRGRHPVEVSFSIDGVEVYHQAHKPSGIWADGESTVYRRETVQAGTHRFTIGMSDSERTGGFDYEQSQQIDLRSGQHLVVEFDQGQQEFIFR